MSTFMAYRNQVNRVINLSAPPQAVLFNNVMTAASYLGNFSAAPTNIRNVFGLVSINDPHYSQTSGTPPNSVYQAVWQSLYYDNPASYDNLWALWPSNIHIPFEGLDCGNDTHSHNFANTAAVNPTGDGHTDPNYIWNEDIYIYMLLNN